MISAVMSATIGQLLRGGQRDEQYVNQLSAELNQTIQNWFGIRRWIQLRPYLEPMSQMMYYSATTLAGLQTLGEEYVNIVQTDGHKLVVPKLVRRFVAVLLQTYSPLLLARLLALLRRRLEDRQSVLPSLVNSDRHRDQMLALLAVMEESMEYVQRIHLIWFYLNGNYYHLSKRVTNIGYHSLNRSMSGRSDGRTQTLYKALGYLSLTQLCISLLVRFYSRRRVGPNCGDSRLQNKDIQCSVNSGAEVRASDRCSLCLEPRRHTTLTTCGHLFCWHCITEWLQLKNECPLCREPLQPSRVVLLNNYL